MAKISKVFSVAAIVGLLALTGCASKGRTTKEINALHAQVGVITDELVRLDQALQETRSSVHGGGQSAGLAASAGYDDSMSFQGGVYRTPSGFELPSLSIQQALKSAGYYQGTLDGKIGPATRDAIRAFQRDNGLTADGIVGRGTWEKLKSFAGNTIK